LYDPVGQRWPLDQFEHERGVAVGLFEAVNDCDVGVTQGCQGFGFTLETSESVRVLSEVL
jgi:hypothetical protein